MVREVMQQKISELEFKYELGLHVTVVTLAEFILAKSCQLSIIATSFTGTKILRTISSYNLTKKANICPKLFASVFGGTC